jgi:hypothetical protein
VLPIRQNGRKSDGLAAFSDTLPCVLAGDPL